MIILLNIKSKYLFCWIQNHLPIALTYEIRGKDERTPVLMVVMVNTVVMPVVKEKKLKLNFRLE